MKKTLRNFEGNEEVENNNKIIPHYKYFLVTHDGKIDDDSILYIGSHNMT